MEKFLKTMYDYVMKYLDSGVGKIKPEWVLIGIPVALVVVFAVFALCKLGSRARRDTKTLKLAAAAVSAKGISDAEDSAALGKSFEKSPALAFAYKRLYASDTLTAYDVFKGKTKKAGMFSLALTLSVVAVIGMVFASLYAFSGNATVLEYGITEGRAFAMSAGFALVALVLAWIFGMINKAQAKRRQAAERAFAEALESALPLAKKNRLKNNEPNKRSFSFEEVKAEHVEAKSSDVENFGETIPNETSEAPAAEPVPAESETAPAPAETAVAVKSESNVDEIIRKINEVREKGASVQTMQQIAMLLQKEREKKENKTVAQQRKLNEALAELLRAMSRYQK